MTFPATLMMDWPVMARQTKPTHRDTKWGELIERAMARKAEDLSKAEGRPVYYGQRAFARDVHVDESTPYTWIHGISRPTPEMVMDVVRAMRPYIDPVEAMIAAGYLPVDATLNRIARRVLRLPPDRIAPFVEQLEISLFGRTQPLLADEVEDALYEWPEERHGRRGARRKRQAKTTPPEDTTTD